MERADEVNMMVVIYVIPYGVRPIIGPTRVVRAAHACGLLRRLAAGCPYPFGLCKLYGFRTLCVLQHPSADHQPPRSPLRQQLVQLTPMHISWVHLPRTYICAASQMPTCACICVPALLRCGLGAYFA